MKDHETKKRKSNEENDLVGSTAKPCIIGWATMPKKTRETRFHGFVLTIPLHLYVPSNHHCFHHLVISSIWSWSHLNFFLSISLGFSLTGFLEGRRVNISSIYSRRKRLKEYYDHVHDHISKYIKYIFLKKYTYIYILNRWLFSQIEKKSYLYIYIYISLGFFHVYVFTN